MIFLVACCFIPDVGPRWICCKGRYCLALVIIVFSWLFNLCKNYFVLRIHFHISYYHCVTCMLYCVARFLTLPPTRVLRFVTRPPRRPDGDIHSAEPPFFFSKWLTPHRVTTAWAQVQWNFSGQYTSWRFQTSRIIHVIGPTVALQSCKMSGTVDPVI